MPVITTNTTITVQDIISRAAKALGYLGRNEVMGAGDANDAVNAFNDMLNSWSNEEYAAYVTTQSTFTLTIGTQTYSIGPGGTINTTRPFKIVGAFIRDSNNLDYPLAIRTREQWDSIGDKFVTSQIPTDLFYDTQYPLGYINIFPIPLAAYTVYYNDTIGQTTYVAVGDSVSMPLGYVPAYIFNLALYMMSYGFPCLLDDRGYKRLTQNAADTLATVKSTNIVQTPADYDPSIWSKSAATYNIYSDSFPRAN